MRVVLVSHFHGDRARYDLTTRPLPAGPAMPIAGAQCASAIETRLAFPSGCDPAAARAAEVGLRAAFAGDVPVLAAGHALLALEPASLVLSALKPAEDGAGIVIRMLNPTGEDVTACLRSARPIAGVEAVRLDETPTAAAVDVRGTEIRVGVPAHALRSLRLQMRRDFGSRCVLW